VRNGLLRRHRRELPALKSTTLQHGQGALTTAARQCSTALMSDRDLVAAQIESLFDELVVHQRKKVLEAARRLNPRLTEDDVQQPQDFPELAGDPAWNYEDGILAGYLAAQMAVRVRLRR
jgi:hypothetical protein